VVLYSYYQYRLNQTNDRVNALINGYNQQFQNAESDLKGATAAGKAQIQAALGPLQQLEAAPATLAGLVHQLAPSLFYVHTLDASGQPSVGTAFVVSSNSSQSLLLTSYETIQAATRQPGPSVFVRQGQGPDTPVTVRTWDQQYDLALIVLPRGNLPAITAAPARPAPTIGQRIFALSGLGAAGASITEGTVTDVSASGIAHDAAIGPDYQGGPLVTTSGQVIAVSSRSYSPLGFTPDSVWYAPFVQAACNKVLSCPNGTVAGSQ
jgi:S1-C subfamily serine protease